MKKLKNDNGGFTLAELLIAIAILAIVMSPLFHNFVESTKLNSKARVAMNATNMASNIAEGLNAYSAEEIIVGFDSADDRGNMAIFPDDITCASHGEVTYSSSAYTLGYTITGTSAAGTPVYVDGGSVSANSLTFEPSADSKYYLYAAGVQQEKTTYDMLIKMDASASSTFSGDLNNDGVIGTGEKELYNDYAEVAITSINRLVDSVYKDNSTVWDDIRADFMGYSGGGTLDKASFDNYFARTIVIDIDMLTEASGNTTKVSVHSDYKYDGYYNPYSIEELSTPNNVIYESKTQYPRDIYVYYYPNYNYDSDKNSTTARGTYPSEQFVINNNAGIDVSVHLIRLAPGDIPAADLAVCEAGYKTKVTLNDATDSEIHTRIYSNLRDNLTADEDDNKEIYRQNAARLSFVYNGLTYQMTDEEYKEVMFENGGLVTQVNDRLYSVVIEVYESGAAAAGFPEDKRVAVYDGASAKQ